MYIRFLTSKKIERPKTRLEVQFQGTSVFRHRSSNLISKGNKATGVITDNHVIFCRKKSLDFNSILWID
ncbi:hypothetical protein SAMN04488104_105026 [Algoriphagus faecimaris]|uniref:Uncharacterized protein n=1 Tax=Algoriphagus faecimaris TaxID=686796 RepID=A0A1G6X2B6_9BACT|nr:hypothetical protein SAMN04488104_105026 [Algoriphagus faecimaris]